MSHQAYIIGGGGHAHVIASFLDRPVLFVVPDSPQPGEISRAEFAVLGRAQDQIDVFLGVGDNATRREEFERLTAMGLTPLSLVAPSAWVAASASIGPGTIVCAGAVVGARAIIGAGAIINTLASIDHDCIVGDHAHVSAGATLGGGATVGAHCLVGMKSGLIPRVALGEGTVVMAGSLVTADLPAGVLVGGSPARVMRKIAFADTHLPPGVDGKTQQT